MIEDTGRSEPVVDFHSQTGDQLIASLKACQIDVAVVAPMLDSPAPDFQARQVVSDAAQRFPGRLVPVAGLDPRYGKTAFKELDTWVGDAGIKGVLFNPLTTCSLPYHAGVLPLMEGAADRGIPVLLVTGNH